MTPLMSNKKSTLTEIMLLYQISKAVFYLLRYTDKYLKNTDVKKVRIHHNLLVYKLR